MEDDDGESFFNVIRICLVCDACKALPTMEDMVECPHSKDMMPPWKDSEKNKRMKKIYAAADSVARHARENLGMMANNYDTVFNRLDVNRIFEKKTRMVHENVNVEIERLYVAVDPNFGGKSMTAIISGYVTKDFQDIEDGSFVVCIINLKIII